MIMTKSVYAGVLNINNNELIQLIKNDIQIIDVRTENEWKSIGVIKDSLLISLLDKKNRFLFEKWYLRFKAKIEKNKSVVFVCASGVRSNYIAQLLKQKKPDLNIYNLKKGINSWIRSGNKIYKLRN
tara:strand:+ start:32 stop:412 length:381 start_codon:yes stop_codon:yes gene_type:complete